MQFTRLLNGLGSAGATVLVAAALAAGPLSAQNAAGQSAPAVKISGVVYSQLEYWTSDSISHTNKFDITRAYLNALGSFAKGVSTRVTLDVFRNSGANTSLAYRLKYAFADWKPQPTSPVDFRFGLTQTPWIDWEEGLWGFRMQGPVPMDRAGYLTSSDYGISMNFQSKDNALNGTAGVYNGEGYGSAPGGRFLDYEARASIRLVPSDLKNSQGGLRLTGYAGLGRTDVAGGPIRDRYVGMLSYKSKVILLAGEAALAKSDTIDSHVFSGYGVLSPPKTNVQIIARVDYTDPNTGVDGDASTRFIGGVAYSISPNLRLLGDLDAVSYQDLTKQSVANRQQRTKLLFQGEFNF